MWCYAICFAVAAYCLHGVLSTTLSAMAKVFVIAAAVCIPLLIYYVVSFLWRAGQWLFNLLKAPLTALGDLFTFLCRGLASLSGLGRLVGYILTTIPCDALFGVANIASGLFGALGVAAYWLCKPAMGVFSRCVPSLPSLGRFPNFGVSPKWRWPSFGKWGSWLRHRSRKPENTGSNDGPSLDAAVLAYGQEQYESLSVAERLQMFNKPFVPPAVTVAGEKTTPKETVDIAEEPAKYDVSAPVAADEAVKDEAVKDDVSESVTTDEAVDDDVTASARTTDKEEAVDDDVTAPARTEELVTDNDEYKQDLDNLFPKPKDFERYADLEKEFTAIYDDWGLWLKFWAEFEAMEKAVHYHKSIQPVPKEPTSLWKKHAIRVKMYADGRRRHTMDGRHHS